MLLPWRGPTESAAADRALLRGELLTSLHWLAAYLHAPLGDVLETPFKPKVSEIGQRHPVIHHERHMRLHVGAEVLLDAEMDLHGALEPGPAAPG